MAHTVACSPVTSISKSAPVSSVWIRLPMPSWEFPGADPATGLTSWDARRDGLQVLCSPTHTAVSATRLSGWTWSAP